MPAKRQTNIQVGDLLLDLSESKYSWGFGHIIGTWKQEGRQFYTIKWSKNRSWLSKWKMRDIVESIKNNEVKHYGKPQ